MLNTCLKTKKSSQTKTLNRNKAMIRKSILLIIILCISLKNDASPYFSVSQLNCEQIENPIAIDTQKPRFSWKIHSQQRGFEQFAYQIIVSDSPDLLSLNKGNMWNSGKVVSPTSLLIEYNGKPLQSQKEYYWKVRIWDKENNVSQWSLENNFSIGLLSHKDWDKACWISLEEDNINEIVTKGITGGNITKRFGEKKTGTYTLPLFRKEIQIKRDLKRAIVYISGLGHFDMFLNGEKVGDHFLDPGWTKYDKHALYVAFDISNQLQIGTNVIGVMLGNGFYNIPRERYLKMLTSYGAPKMIFKLRLEYKNGQVEHVVSDDTWKAFPGPITFSSIYGGEDYDANKTPEGWTKINFNAKEWPNALCSKWTTLLKLQQADPLKIREKLLPVRIFQAKNGNWIYDFGQNFSGIISTQILAKGKRSVKFHPAELLNIDSTINQSASGRPYFFTYKTKGDSLECWQPQFSYYGFRYVQVEGAVPKGKPNPNHLPEIEQLIGLHTCNSAKKQGDFYCSNKLFNQIFNLIDWSVRSNLASVLTDCPHREKLGWLEVAHLMFYSIHYRYDVVRFYRKVMDDMKSTQAVNGCIPTTAPELVEFSQGFKDTPEWGSAFIIIPWYIYQCYGDMRPLVSYYEDMKKYIKYLSSKAENNIISYGLGDWFDIGPNNPGESQLTSNGVTATAIYYYDVCIMQKIAQLLNNSKDFAYYKNLASQIKQSFNNRFWNKETCKYDRDSQTANAIALYMGLVNKKNVNVVLDNLKHDIQTRNNALTAGDIGYRYVLRALEKNDASKIIYEMNNKYDVPGYGWQIAHGATALTESWQAYGFVSNNHCMLGHLQEWLFSGLGGIQQMENSIAYKQIKIKPEIVGDINEVRAAHQSPYGMIISHWQKEDNLFRLFVSIPANTTAYIFLPEKDPNKINESGIQLQYVADVKMVDIEQNRTVVQIGSGVYQFEIKE